MVKPHLKIIAYLLLITVISCQSIQSSFNINQTGKPSVELASIGQSGGSLFEDTFENIAIADYKKPIKVSVSIADFSRSDYKSFLNTKKSQPSSVEINYIDSIKTKPQYVKLKIIDRIGIIDALNSLGNTSLKELLTNQDHSEIITSISAALGQAQIKQLMKADEVFLVPNGIKSYALQTYIDKLPKELIKFNDMVVFDYQPSCLCWQEDTRRQLKIVDLVEGSNCPKGTYRSAKQAKKKIDYFKF